MNEQIKQLAIQAADGMLSYNAEGEFRLNQQEVFKFAKLIVRQCAMKANATALDLRNRPELDARKYVGDCILKCFGVEE